MLLNAKMTAAAGSASVGEKVCNNQKNKKSCFLDYEKNNNVRVSLTGHVITSL